jgi:hypothetical protein
MTNQEKIQALREGIRPDKVFSSMFEFAQLMIAISRENDEMREQVEKYKKISKQKVELLKLDVANALYEIAKNHG